MSRNNSGMRRGYRHIHPHTHTHSEALAKRRDFNIEHIVQKAVVKESQISHDCVQVEELKKELEQLKVCMYTHHSITHTLHDLQLTISCSFFDSQYFHH